MRNLEVLYLGLDLAFPLAIKPFSTPLSRRLIHFEFRKILPRVTLVEPVGTGSWCKMENVFESGWLEELPQDDPAAA